jgi:hypothetical protein
MIDTTGNLLIVCNFMRNWYQCFFVARPFCIKEMLHQEPVFPYRVRRSAITPLNSQLCSIGKLAASCICWVIAQQSSQIAK